MDADELELVVNQAENLMDEDDTPPIVSSQRGVNKSLGANLTDSDIIALRKRHPFLVDFSDRFIRSQTVGDLMKIQTATIKIQEFERGKDAEDRLAANKASLLTSFSDIEAGKDNRVSHLHIGRFLGGAGCSAVRLWLTARQMIDIHGYPPIGCYDMGAVGLAGYVSAKGWIEIANPASTKLSIKMFNINSCKLSKGDELSEFSELNEFKLALRALRTALSMVMPWNFSVLALEGFFFQTNFCNAELMNVEKKSFFLAKFTDYALHQNADRWRDAEPFLTAGELKTAFASFFGAQPQAALQSKVKKGAGSKSGSAKQVDPKLTLGVCFAWNQGQCTKASGTCTTTKGRPLKHICDHVADQAKPLEICGKEHIRKDFHK